MHADKHVSNVFLSGISHNSGEKNDSVQGIEILLPASPKLHTFLLSAQEWD